MSLLITPTVALSCNIWLVSSSKILRALSSTRCKGCAQHQCHGYHVVAIFQLTQLSFSSPLPMLFKTPASFCFKRQTFVAVQPSLNMTTACWRPWNHKLMKPETRFQSEVIWNCNLLSSYVNWQTAKPLTAVTMLMLVQFHSSHDQTLIKHSTVHPKQVEYEDSLLRHIQVLVL